MQFTLVSVSLCQCFLLKPQETHPQPPALSRLHDVNMTFLTLLFNLGVILNTFLRPSATVEGLFGNLLPLSHALEASNYLFLYYCRAMTLCVQGRENRLEEQRHQNSTSHPGISLTQTLKHMLPSACLLHSSLPGLF